LTAGDVYRALWRHKAVIVLLTCVFVGATWYAVSRETRRYEASTLVRIQERGPGAGDASAALLAAQTLAQTYAKIIGSGALRGEMDSIVSACTSSPAPTARRKGTSSGVPASSCRSLGGARAARIANRKISEVALSAGQVQDLDLLSVTTRSENPTRAMVVANAAPLALKRFIRQTGSRSERIVVAKAATVPSSPISRQLALKVAVALMLGLLFNGALALLAELFRDRLPETEELGQALGQPVLATIPSLRLKPVDALLAGRHEDPSLAVGDGSGRRTGSGVEPER